MNSHLWRISIQWTKKETQIETILFETLLQWHTQQPPPSHWDAFKRSRISHDACDSDVSKPPQTGDSIPGGSLRFQFKSTHYGLRFPESICSSVYKSQLRDFLGDWRVGVWCGLGFQGSCCSAWTPAVQLFSLFQDPSLFHQMPPPNFE